MGAIRILLADDHMLFRRGIAQLLALEPDLEVVGEAADGAEAYRKTLELRPDVVLMDLEMPRCNGFDAIEMIRQKVPQAVIVALTYSVSEQHALEALRRGAQGYLLKDMEPDKLCDGIREAFRGESPIAGAVARKVLLASASQPVADPVPESPGVRLTPREVQILELVAAGATNKEIGTALFLSENTVKNHVKRILAKIEVENRAQAVAWASREGIL